MLLRILEMEAHRWKQGVPCEALVYSRSTKYLPLKDRGVCARVAQSPQHVRCGDDLGEKDHDLFPPRNPISWGAFVPLRHCLTANSPTPPSSDSRPHVQMVAYLNQAGLGNDLKRARIPSGNCGGRPETCVGALEKIAVKVL